MSSRFTSCLLTVVMRHRKLSSLANSSLFKLPDGTIRSSSLSDCQPGMSMPKVYRFPVKKSGSASEWMHQSCLPSITTLELRAPAGDLHLPATFPSRRQVFISAGIGITPLFTMLESHLAAMPDFIPVFLHAAQDSTHHTFRSDLKSRLFKPSRRATFYTKPLPEDVLQN